ncbi:hypothetical protein B0H19DRAFT_1083935 [Mycena capillaripes]|nr:hypothetical protein B0H19DRAFT_1083935 [Mycena capillaripes]
MDELLRAVRHPFWRDHMPLLPAFKRLCPQNTDWRNKADDIEIGQSPPKDEREITADGRELKCRGPVTVTIWWKPQLHSATHYRHRNTGRSNIFCLALIAREPLFECSYFQTTLHINAAADVALDFEFGPLTDHGIGINGLLDASWALQIAIRILYPSRNAPLSFQPSLEVGIDLRHALDVIRDIEKFDSIFRALATGPFHSW